MSDGTERGRLARLLDGLSDLRLVGLIAAVLFVLAAWPLLLVDLPPLQDLPNHLAAGHIVAHPELYPEYAFNGFLKSNSLLPLWFYLVAPSGGPALFAAARGFTAIVLALNALALPIFVLRFAGRRVLPVAALFFWPLVHGFFVSMGMMNFTAGVALSLMLLALVDRQRERPTLVRGGAVAAMAVIVWYAHAFPLAVVAGLVALHAVTRARWTHRFTAALTLLLPMAPAALLAAGSAQHHLVKVEGATAWAWSHWYQSPLGIVAHLWTDASGAFTGWGSMTIVPALLLPVFVWRRWREKPAPVPPFVSLPGAAMLAVAYVALPMMLSNWWHFNCRMVPFLWACMLVRLPATVPRPVAIALGVCALAFSAVTGVDYVRLDRDRAQFTAAMDAVPRHATLLPLMFHTSKTSYYTASLTHAWGHYTVRKDASAPMVFAVERSYPITYREFPPRILIPPALDGFAESFATPARVCKDLHQPGVNAACRAVWTDRWGDFWADALPRFSHVVTWAMPPEARALIPARYHSIFAAGDLEAFARE